MRIFILLAVFSAAVVANPIVSRRPPMTAPRRTTPTTTITTSPTTTALIVERTTGTTTTSTTTTRTTTITTNTEYSDSNTTEKPQVIVINVPGDGEGPPNPSANAPAQTDCNEFELEEMELANQACFVEADGLILENLGSGNPLGAVCKTIDAKIACYEENVPRCYDDAFLQRVKDNFLFDQVEGAHNRSEDLGDAFIQSCPVLREAEKRLVTIIFGHDECDGATAFKQRRDKQTCDREASQARDNKLQLLQFLSGPGRLQHFTKTQCETRAAWDKCNEVLTCFSDLKKFELLLQDSFLYARLEAEIQAAGVEGFTYAETCAGILSNNEAQDEEKPDEDQALNIFLSNLNL